MDQFTPLYIYLSNSNAAFVFVQEILISIGKYRALLSLHIMAKIKI
jgi:hypothetical protein